MRFKSTPEGKGDIFMEDICDEDSEMGLYVQLCSKLVSIEAI